MIVNDSILNENGDEIIFQTVPLHGLDTITSFTDTVTGIVTNVSLQKSFAFSFDGVVFTKYIPLTNQNLIDNINGKLTDKTAPILRFKYRLISTISFPSVEIVSLQLNGTYSKKKTNFPISSKSNYKELVYDNIDVHNLMVNLVEKLYERGIVPEYMTRGEENNDIFEDKDYIEFWSIIAKFFSIFLIDAFKFTNVYFQKKLLNELITQKGIFINSKTSLIDLQLIAQNFYDEIRQRGGFDIFREKGYEYPVGRRNAYEIPLNVNPIMPAYPVYIDGVVYTEIDELPFGWTVQTINGKLYLIAPDVNYHHIRFIEIPAPPPDGDYNDDFNDDYDTDGIPTSQTSQVDGDYNYHFNDDFNLAGNPLIVPIILPQDEDSKIFKRYDGEYLRLIAYDPKDEFIFNQTNLKDIGWNFGNSSPFYKGLRIQYNKSLIKAYEETNDFVDLDKYPILP